MIPSQDPRLGLVAADRKRSTHLQPRLGVLFYPLCRPEGLPASRTLLGAGPISQGCNVSPRHLLALVKPSLPVVNTNLLFRVGQT